MVYVSPLRYGCGYPTLLFAHRGLLGDGESPLAEEEHIVIAQQRGFDLRFDASHWGEMDIADCGRSVWVCAAQERSFIDEGSLRGRIAPLQGAPLQYANRWRLDLRPCSGGCLLSQRSGEVSRFQKFLTLV